MSDYHKIQSAFWLSGTGKKLRGDTCAQLVAVYLMSSPHANMIGVYHCPHLYVAHETGTGLEAVEQAIRTLSDAGYCTFDNDSEYVFVHRMAAYQIGESLSAKDNRVASVKKAVESLPDFPMKQMFIRRYAEAYHLQDLIDDNVVLLPKDECGDFMEGGELTIPRFPEASKVPVEGKGKRSDTPSKPLERTFRAPSEPLTSSFEAPCNDLQSPFEAPLEDLGSPLEGYILDLTAACDDIASPFGGPLEDLGSPLQAPCKPLASPSEASSSNSNSNSSSNSSVPPAPNAQNDAPIKLSPGVRKRTTGEDAPTAKTWNAYSQAYQGRYGTEPVRNQKVNSQLANLVKRLGQDESPAVAAFFVNHNGLFYVRGMHQVDLLLRDAEKLRTEWVTRQQPVNRQPRGPGAPQSSNNPAPGRAGIGSDALPTARPTVVHL